VVDGEPFNRLFGGLQTQAEFSEAFSGREILLCGTVRVGIIVASLHNRKGEGVRSS